MSVKNNIRRFIRLVAVFFFALIFVQAFAKDNIEDICDIAEKRTQGSCYLAFDFGYSGGIKSIEARSDKWVKFDPTLYTRGKDGVGGKANDIVLRVEGGWKPWGNFGMEGYCKWDDCVEKGTTIVQGCYPDGKDISKGKDRKNIPCCIEDGYGLYGLIALNGPNGIRDPNSTTINPNDFATFRVGPLQVDEFNTGTTKYDQSSEKVKIKTFTIGSVDVWDPSSLQFVKRPIPNGGKLYFKIVDTYYTDNVGGYTVKIRNGAFAKKKGMIAMLIDYFTKTFHTVSNTIYQNIVKDSGFRTTLMVMLTLYVTLTVILFMIGVVEINHTELVIRLFKVGVVVTLISDDTLKVIPNIFEGFILGALEISSIIMQNSMYSLVTGEPLLPFPNIENVFSAYDEVINMCVSRAFNLKIWALLFTSKFYLIMGIYVCVIIMFVAMWRSLVQYIMSFFILALLIVTLPIFLVFILFKSTIHFFDNWLEQFIGACLMLIVITATVALMLSFVITELQELLQYTVCYQSIWRWEILSIEILDFWFWAPSDWSQFSSAATAEHVFYVFVATMLFRGYIDYVPELVDALGDVARRPLTSFYGGVGGGIIGSMNKFLENNVYNTKSYKYMRGKVQSARRIVSPVHYIDFAASKLSGGKIKKGAILSVASNTYKAGSNLIANKYKTFVSNQEGHLGVFSTRDSDDVRRFENRYGKYGYKLVGKGLGNAAIYGWKKGKKLGNIARTGWQKLRGKDEKSLARADNKLMEQMLEKDGMILEERMNDVHNKYEQLTTARAHILREKDALQNELNIINISSKEIDAEGAILTRERQNLMLDKAIYHAERDLEAMKNNRGGVASGVKRSQVDEEQHQMMLDEAIYHAERDLEAMKNNRGGVDLGVKRSQVDEEQHKMMLDETIYHTEKDLVRKENALQEREQKLAEYTEQYHANLNVYNEMLDSYKEELVGFKQERSLVKEEMQLYQDQKMVLSGELSYYELQEEMRETQMQLQEKLDPIIAMQEKFSQDNIRLEKELEDLDESNAKLEADRVALEAAATELDNHAADQNNYQRMQEQVQEREAALARDEAALEERNVKYSKKIDKQIAEYQQFVEEINRKKEELENIQAVYKEQDNAVYNQVREIKDMWSNKSLEIDDVSLQEPADRQDEDAAPAAEVERQNEEDKDVVVDIERKAEAIREHMQRLKDKQEELSKRD